LAGGAEDVEPVAAVVEKVAGERQRAIGIGLAVFTDRGRDCGDDAGQRSFRHYPPTLKAASAAMLTRSESFADRLTICTGLSSPTRIGPMTVAPPSSCRS